jgi:hypothetical protein
MTERPTADALDQQRRLIAEGRVKAKIEDTAIGSIWLAHVEGYKHPFGIGDTRADAIADLQEILA